IYATLSESEAERDARRLVEFIDSRGGRVTARELQRSNSRKYPTADPAERALANLVEAGMGEWEQQETTSRGGQPTRVFVLCPTHDTTDRTPPVTAGGGQESPGGGADRTPESDPATPPKHSGSGGSVGSVTRRTEGESTEGASEGDSGLCRAPE